MALPNSISARVEALTARRDGTAAEGEPVPAVPLNPIDEVFLEEVAAMLPEPLRARLRSAPDPGQFQDWLSAGAVFALVAGDPYLREQFLTDLRLDPRRAAQAAVRALAARMEPPPRSAAWWRLDRLGLALQAGLAATFLAVRGVLFAALAWWLAPAPLSGAPSLFLRGLVAADALTAPPAPLLPLLLLLSAGWLVSEVLLGPRAMEWARRLPAKWSGQPPPVGWRTDAAHLMWVVQAGALAILLGGRACWVVSSSPPHVSSEGWVMSVGVIASSVGLACTVLHQLRSVVYVGTAESDNTA